MNEQAFNTAPSDHKIAIGNAVVRFKENILVSQVFCSKSIVSNFIDNLLKLKMFLFNKTTWGGCP